MSEATEITHHKSKGCKGVDVCHHLVQEGQERQAALRQPHGGAAAKHGGARAGLMGDSLGGACSSES